MHQKPSTNKRARKARDQREKGLRKSTDLSGANHLPTIGRPPRLTDDIKEKICRALKLGLSMESAAALGGVRSETVYGWIRRGRAARAGGYSPFVRAIELAMAEFEARNAAVVNQAAGGRHDAEGRQVAPPDWRAALMLLERRRAKVWARTEKHEVSGKDGDAIKYEIVREKATDWRAAIVSNDTTDPVGGN